MQDASKKEKIYFLYAGEKSDYKQINELFCRVNNALNGQNIEIVMEYTYELMGYSEGTIHIDDFNHFQSIFFLLEDEGYTIGQEVILRQYVKYYQQMYELTHDINKTKVIKHICCAYIFKKRISQSMICGKKSSGDNRNIEESLLKSVGYIVSCKSIDSMLLGILLVIQRSCKRQRCSFEWQMHKNMIYLKDNFILSVELVPEFKNNKKLQEMQQIILLVEKDKDIPMINKEELLDKLIEEKNKIQQRLLFTMEMIYDIMKQWDSAGRDISQDLYRQILLGVPMGW